MENQSVPPSLTVGLAYNLKKGAASAAEDAEAEYDSYDTVEAIGRAMRSAGIKVVFLEADSDFAEKVKGSGVDIVFNIAEGRAGRGREAQVPAILDFLGIPFSGSDETTLCLALDKALTKRFLSTYHIATPAYSIVKDINFTHETVPSFPVIVKPDCEGSSKGISDFAVADDERQLSDAVEKNLARYGQPLLVEKFIRGREFTVGVLGNGSGMKVFEPMEIIYKTGDRASGVYSFRVKKDYQKYVTYSCPSRLDDGAAERMKKTAAKIHTALDCKDFSRIDFRLSEDGVPYFIEINPLPGLAPGYSDYPMLAEFCGMDYRTLILSVLNSALKRYGMNEIALNRGELQ